MNKLRKSQRKTLKTQGSIQGSMIHLQPLNQLIQEQKYSNSNFLKLSSIQEDKKQIIFTKSNNFSAIFVQNKRKDYSGYKEYSLKKISKALSSSKQKCLANSISQQTNRINQKPVPKLRKRYSLQPVILRKKLQLLNVICKNQSSNSIKDPFAQCIDSGREHCKSLRSMIQSLKKPQISERPFVFGQNISTNNQKQVQNQQIQTNFHRYNLSLKNKPIVAVITENFGQQISIQKSLIHYKKKVQLKLKQNKLLFKDNYSETKRLVPKEFSGDLCGWSNSSFYPQNKISLIEGIEKNSK